MNLQPTFDALTLVPFTAMTEDMRHAIRDIRNEPAIRQNMYTDHEIGADEHSAWLRSLADNPTVAWWGVVMDGQLVGAAGLSRIDRAHHKADWAFYLSEAAQGAGLGAALEFKFLDMVFSEQGLRKLNAEVLAFNTRVLKLHQRFGFEVEGRRRDQVWREDSPIDAILIGIRRDEWLTKRKELAEQLKLAVMTIHD